MEVVMIEYIKDIFVSFSLTLQMETIYVFQILSVSPIGELAAHSLYLQIIIALYLRSCIRQSNILQIFKFDAVTPMFDISHSSYVHWRR